MKALLTGVLAVILAGGATYAVVNNQNDPQEVTAELKTDRSLDIPTKRTVDLQGNAPWQWAKPELIEEWQQADEVVYLWQDAEGIESLLQNGIDSDPEGYAAKSKYVELFVNEMKKHQLNEDYLSKLQESAELLANGDPEESQVKLNEAKKIRTQ